MRTLGQKRAAFALEKVTTISCDNPKEFKTFSAGAPSMILQNGFGQALAFWYAKGGQNQRDKHRVLLDILQEWLCLCNGDVRNRFIPPCTTPREMVAALAAMSQDQYLAAQKEALALLEWIKRYANALLKGK
jgi:CRISPR-associated protein Cmr5